MRTILIVAGALSVGAAFVAIGDSFLLVFVGIFLALVFEFPVRFVMARTRMSRGLAATITVLGTALAVTALFLALLVPARPDEALPYNLLESRTGRRRRSRAKADPRVEGRMSFLLRCPNCGLRDVSEFRSGGQILDGAVGNLPGPQRERWQHRFGCRLWLVAERDVRTNEVLRTAPLDGGS